VGGFVVGERVTGTAGVSLARVAAGVGGRGWKGVRVAVGSSPGVVSEGLPLEEINGAPAQAVKYRLTSNNTAGTDGERREDAGKVLILRKSLPVR
jgi:hypothetical protein